VARPRAARGDGDQLREQLIEATAALLAERGDERAVTIRAIVDAVGVTPPSLYLHFPTKQDLVREVVERRYAALGQAIGQAVAEPAERGDAAAALRAGCLAYLRWAHDDPGGYQVLFGTRRDTQPVPPEGSTHMAAFTSLQQGIGFCQATGVGREGDVTRMATLLWASLHGLATLVPTRPEFGWPTLETMVDELIAGLVGIGR
jgi:AcrR family transcriptional regulator